MFIFPYATLPFPVSLVYQLVSSSSEEVCCYRWAVITCISLLNSWKVQLHGRDVQSLQLFSTWISLLWPTHRIRKNMCQCVFWGGGGMIGRSEVDLNTCASRLYCTTYVSIASSLRRLHAQLTFNWTIVFVPGYMPRRVIELTMKSCHDRWWFAHFYTVFVIFS